MTVFPATAQFRLHRKCTIRNGSGHSKTITSRIFIGIGFPGKLAASPTQIREISAFIKRCRLSICSAYCPGTRCAMTLTRILTTKLIITVYSPSTWVAIAK